MADFNPEKTINISIKKIVDWCIGVLVNLFFDRGPCNMKMECLPESFVDLRILNHKKKSFHINNTESPLIFVFLTTEVLVASFETTL